jgi:hypothetical protein
VTILIVTALALRDLEVLAEMGEADFQVVGPQAIGKYDCQLNL